MGKTFWDRVAGVYHLSEATNKQAVEGMAARVLGLVPAGASVLECAGGTGVISAAVAPRAGTVLCTDLSLPMLEQAQKRAARLGLANISFAERDIFHLPDKDGAWDVVCAGNVLHLLDNPALAVAELWRVTAPGGLLILPTFLMGGAKPVFRLLAAGYRLLGFRARRKWTMERYRTFFEGLPLPPGEYSQVDGRLPVGMAVFRKPQQRSEESI